MTVQTGSITNADILVNGVDIAGRVMELDLGEFGYTEIEHKALGMIGVLKLPSRAVEAIEATPKYEFLEPALKRQIMNPTKTHRLQLHQYVDVNDNEGLNLEQSHTLVHHIGFRTMKTTQGSSKLGENVEMEQNISVISIVTKVYGEEVPILEYDVFNNIHKVDGKDVWPR
jgi:hypothetical protein